VGLRGLEPPLLAKYAPQAYAYTSSATSPNLSILPQFVPRGRVELPSPYGHSVLNTACLPFHHLGAYLILTDSFLLDNLREICDYSCMKKVALFVSFFVFTPVLLSASILYLLFLSYDSNSYNGLVNQNPNQSVAFAALPSVENVLEDNIGFKDARIEMVRQFFARYKSPLEPFASNVVEDADKYSLDFRLVPSIAMQESNLCKKIITDSYNCWGFGIYGKKITRFESFPEAIETVTKTLSQNYIAGGLNTPEEIMKKYTPSSNGSWANNVNYYMDLLQ
jgi:hypothetical protein